MRLWCAAGEDLVVAVPCSSHHVDFLHRGTFKKSLCIYIHYTDIQIHL